MNNAKDTVEKLYKGNGKLYFACLFVGLITGAIVSCYRWGLEEIGIFRKAYFSTLPIKAIQNEITKNNIPASISNTAGTFVCNHVFYGVRYLVEKKYKGKKSGFIHIPYLPEQVIGKADTPSMSLDNILKGITIAIEIIFSVENDIKKIGGSIC